MEIGAYRPINPALIGRKDDEILGFTSQSGKTAVYEIISEAGYPISIQEAIRITPIAKEAAQKVGELPTRSLIDIYFREIFEVKGPFEKVSLKQLDECTFELCFKYKDEVYTKIGKGNGPLDACLDALKQAGFVQKLLHYEQFALDEEIMGSGASAMSVIHLEDRKGTEIIARAKDENTAKANVKAIFNGLNIIYKN
jgi:2-isopropylmalate synthase